MNVHLDILGRIRLYHPIDIWKVQSASGHVGCKEHRMRTLQEVEVELGSCILLQFAVQCHQWNTRLQRAENLPYMSNLRARRQENDGLAFQMGFDKGVDCIEFVMQWYRHHTLFQSRGCLARFLVVHPEILWFVQAQRCQIRHALRLRCREQHGLPPRGIVVVVILPIVPRRQVIQYPHHLISKSHVQYPIGLVQHQDTNTIHFQSSSLFQMLK
mmetsp:Transcript_32136/g.67550  ORF Transcript_32136/g.67550 Transcript_32136/m.67550 type:complete len:214 (-) Transcript_32136:502-1143(-)